MDVTVVLHYERIEIRELDVVVSVERLSKAEFVKGSNMSPQTIVMFEIVGDTMEKHKPYFIVQVTENSDGILFKIDN